MTTITIHLGKTMDGAAGNTGIASGGRNPTPTARLILYPSDCSTPVKEWISCVYSSTDSTSTKKVDQLTKDFKIPTRGYSTSAFNTWKLGEEDKASISRLQMLTDLTPEEKAQGGESFNSFKNRVVKEFKALMKDVEEECSETSLLVAPPMTIQMIYAYVEAKEDKKTSKDSNDIDIEEFYEGEFKDICPYLVTKKGDEYECEELHGEDCKNEDKEEY